MAEKRSDSEVHDTPDKSGLLYPFIHNGFSLGILNALVPAIVACVMARAPQYQVSKLFGQDLPVPLDAISAILVAPLYFLLISGLLFLSAKRASKPKETWTDGDVRFLGGSMALLGVTAIFLLAQFFLILSPAGKCSQRPHWDLLWSTNLGKLQVQHCMSTAAAINQHAWYYLQPVILQAWLNIALVGASLYLMWGAWQLWRRTVRGNA